MSDELGPRFHEAVLRATGAAAMEIEATLQELWSGYGRILRIRLDGARADTVIAKHVRPPARAAHPRGWQGAASHARKSRSYQVEAAWYRGWSGRCGEACRVPAFLACEEHAGETLLVLEDLDAAGFPVRRRSVTPAQLDACLRWLAHFHATFLGAAPDGLWETGTYWHLATRAEELAALDDPPLKNAAPEIDRILREARFQTIVHGDAKLANFCFSESGDRVAAVDFQYVGGGCGMKDLAYFIGSCFDEAACESREHELLGRYFSHLRADLRRRPDIDAAAVEDEWRGLFPAAWADFHRFLKGWSPGHWKIHGYSERVTRRVVEEIGNIS